jgi:hypothetical protein
MAAVQMWSADDSTNQPTITSSHAIAFAVSPPLRELANLPGNSPYTLETAHNVRQHANVHPSTTQQYDPVEQDFLGADATITAGLSLLGLDNAQACSCQPPDTNAAVGDNQVVEWVNVAYAVYDKNTGNMEAGPIAANLIWQSLGGRCAQFNDGDPVVQWDRTAHRWLLAQNVFHNPYDACVAVSTSNDALGTYNLYQFPLTNGFPDYPKWGIWPTGYFQTNNANTAQVCAYNSAKLLIGDRTAEQVCVNTSANDFSLLPGDLDSNVQPPAGQDEFFIGSYLSDPTNSHLYLYSMRPNYANPSQTVFTGNNLANPISVPNYTPFCPLSEFCVPQNGTTQKVDALGDRLMYRFAYWDDGALNHVPAHATRLPQQHWYVNHVVTASGGQAAVRWYEFRTNVRTSAITDVRLFQSGTYAPDSNNRWMASIAQDKMGNIALGYSLSSTTVFDSIYVAGRTTSDPVGQLETEVPLTVGTGSQSSGQRWGDYSSMMIDGSDGCTFWYAQEYYIVPAGGSQWQTRLNSFKFAGCQ